MNCNVHHRYRTQVHPHISDRLPMAHSTIFINISTPRHVHHHQYWLYQDAQARNFTGLFTIATHEFNQGYRLILAGDCHSSHHIVVSLATLDSKFVSRQLLRSKHLTYDAPSPAFNLCQTALERRNLSLLQLRLCFCQLSLLLKLFLVQTLQFLLQLLVAHLAHPAHLLF